MRRKKRKAKKTNHVNVKRNLNLFNFNAKNRCFQFKTVASVNHATVSSLNAVNNNPMLVQIQLQKQHQQQLHPQNQQQ